MTEWKQGPLPPETYGWGGVVPADHQGSGFYFADFGGDHVEIYKGTRNCRVLKPEDVAWYANCLELPPCDPARGGGGVDGKK